MIDTVLSTGYTSLRNDEIEGLKRTRINGITEEELGDETEFGVVTYEELKKMIENNEGCKVEGTAEIRIVPGQIQFGTDQNSNILSKLKREEPEMFKRVQLDHYFKELVFGGCTCMYKIKERFAEFPEHILFDMVKEESEEAKLALASDPDEKHYNYFKFVKLVPHIFIDASDANDMHDFSSWSYSLT